MYGVCWICEVPEVIDVSDEFCNGGEGVIADECEV